MDAAAARRLGQWLHRMEKLKLTSTDAQADGSARSKRALLNNFSCSRQEEVYPVSRTPWAAMRR